MSELENKIRGILGLYGFYKHQLNTVQRVALLTTWVEVCVTKEEYEVANALQAELDKITSGQEEYYLIAPAVQNNLLGPAGFVAPTMDEIKNRIAISIAEKPKKKKLTWVNNWGSGSFTVFKLKFGDFKLIIFNVGVEMK